MFGKRGQGAMEYLMTYGWAILVVMIVGIVMWQLGIFNMGGTTVTSTGFAKIKPQLAGTGLSRNGNFVGIFTNGVGTTIVINEGTDTEVVDMTDTTSSCQLAVPDSNTIPAGANFQVSGAGCVTAGSAGDIYNVRVSLAYTVAVGGVSTEHIESGTIRGPME